MRKKQTRIQYFIFAPLFTMIMSVSSGAQTPAPATDPNPTTQATSTQDSIQQPTPAKSSLERQFFKNLLRDQKAIWTSPFHLHKHDTQWIIPVLGGTAALMLTDDETAEHLGDNSTRLSISRGISRIGVETTGLGISGAFYLAGRLTHNERARETGILGAESLIDGIIVGEVLKAVAQRQRPTEGGGHGRFFQGGSAFPSGHSVSAWALATVIANEYHKSRLVQISAYSVASLVSMSRFVGRNHYLSDVFVGSAIGFGIGRYVYRHRHDSTLDASDKTPRFNLSPHFRPGSFGQASEYGVALAYNLGR